MSLVRLLGFACTLLAALASAPAAGAAGVPVPSSGLYIGMSTNIGTTVENGIAQLDASTGAKHAISRNFFQWDSLIKNGALNAEVTQAIAAGRTPSISVKAAENGGQMIKFAAIANGSRDADIRAMARALKATNKPLFFTFQHEPESQVKEGWGSQAEYRAAWQRVVTVFRAEGATNVSFSMILTGYSYDTGAAQGFYPGDSYIDWIGTDPYAFNGCLGKNPGEMWDFRRLMEKSVAFAQQHGKPLIVEEYGIHASTSADKLKKAQWFVDARSIAKTMPTIKALVYFHHDNHDGSGCLWGFNNDSNIRSAYSSMAKDPYFAKNPLTTETTTPPTGTLSAPTGVTATAGNGSIDVRWNAVSGATEYSLRYGDGTDADTWVTGITTPNHTITGLTNGRAYVISVRAVAGDATKSDYSTSVTATPVAPIIFGAPTGVTATAGIGTIDVRWNAVSSATEYTLRYGDGTDADTWVTGITTTNHTITGLTNGRSYLISVRALNTDGMKSDYSAPVSATPTFGSPISTGQGGSAGEAPITLTTLPSRTAATNTPDVTGASSSDPLIFEENMRVYDTIQVGSMIYLAGNFNRVGGMSRNGLASYNASTGAVSSWNPNVGGGEVRALAASPDGSAIFAGGDFATVGGVARANVAKINASTGALITSFKPTVSAGLYGLATNGTRLYMGGRFTSVSGVTTGNVAAVDLTSGALTSWRPNVTGGSVRAVKVTNDGKTVFIGGTFVKVGSATRTHLAGIDAASGAATGWAPTWPIAPTKPQPVFDITLSPDGKRLYAAVAGSGADGGNRVRAFNPTAGFNNELWKAAADGDHNAVAATNNHVYVGGHFDFTGNGATHKKLYVVNAADGSYTSWDGGLTSITGTYALTIAGNSLLVSGSNATPKKGHARYSG